MFGFTVGPTDLVNLCRWYKAWRRSRARKQGEHETAAAVRELRNSTALAKLRTSPDGREAALQILRASTLQQAEDIYARYNQINGRFSAHFVNKAYMHRLNEAGKREAANAFHRDVASNDPDSVKDSVEFAYLVQEAAEES